jgi:methyl-accepting chemotaxis protein
MRRLFPLLLLGILLLAAGCGGSKRLSADEYKARLKTLDQEVSKAEAAAQRAVESAATVEQIRSALRRIASTQQHVGDEVAKLKPPKKAEAANALLARAAHDLAAEIRDVVKKLASVPKPQAALSLIQNAFQNARGARELDQAVGELKKLGFSAGS